MRHAAAGYRLATSPCSHPTTYTASVVPTAQDLLDNPNNQDAAQGAPMHAFADNRPLYEQMVRKQASERPPS